MKNKAFLPLMEQMFMILFFALAAAICLQGFAKANQISHTQQQKDQAVMAAQNAAEVLKQTQGDLEETAKTLQGSCEETAAAVFYDENWQPVTQENAAFTLRIDPLSSDIPLLGSASVRVLSGETVLFELTVSWQEVQ